MRRFLTRVCISIGAAVLLISAVAVVAGLVSWLGAPGIADGTVLELDLEQAFVEDGPADPLEFVRGRQPRLRDVVEGLERAAADDRVAALVARVGAAPLGIATVQELRDAVAAFRAGGKPAIAYAETFGEFGPGNVAYYLATAFDEIYLQPSGDVGLTGLLAESPFLRGTFEKLGVVPRMDHRDEYKNALNLFTESEFTEAHREATGAVVASQFGQVVRGIAEGRGLTEAQVRELCDRGPHFGVEAADAKLVDGLAYRDEMRTELEERFGEDFEHLSLSAYLDRAGRPHREGDAIALIFGVGAVHRGKSGYDPASQSATMGSDTVTRAFRAAVDDDEVKAILFRVNSPGGSYVASDTIWRETLHAREQGKPVVVSMGDVAGSGGYFVAAGADRIVAQPGTVTGSIGVVAGKILTDGFWAQLGVTWDGVPTSEHATFYSTSYDYSETEYARLQAFLDRAYDDFTTKVASGRDLELERVREIAKGRIWSGEDALELGLVDVLGGYPTALRLVREVAGLEPDAPVELRVFPRPRSTLELLLERAQARIAAAAELDALVPLARAAAELGLTDAASGPLQIPEVPRVR